MTGHKQYLAIIFLIVAGLGAGKIYSAYRDKIILHSIAPFLKEPDIKKKVGIKGKKAKTIYVSIKGAVNNPGSYTLPENSRFENLIKAAGGYREGAFQLKKNYYLKNGMEFTIKYREKIKISIFGEVKKPGEYEMYRGQRFSDLLKRAGGVTSLGVSPKINYFLKDGKRFFIPKQSEMSQ